MKVNKLGEFGLIERIRRRFTPYTLHLTRHFIGIGDDTAVIKISPKKYFLWTTDILTEGIHFFSPFKLSTFNFQLSTGFMLGWKSLAVNLSDIAAMGGIPKYALVTLGLTGKEDVKFIDDLYRGMKNVAQGFSPAVQILGGDTSKSPALMIDTSVIGEVRKGNLILRKGARPGDRICVTGFCGDSAAGFEMLKKKVSSIKCQVSSRKNDAQCTTNNARYLILRHLMPTPRLKESQVIAKNHLATSMIDNSDGLLASVKFLCQPSGVGAKIYQDKAPISSQLRLVADGFSQRHIVNLALTGGEDYELIFTVPPKKLKYALKAIPKLTGTPVTAVGEITKNKGIYVMDAFDRKQSVKKMGFDHFM